MASTEPANGVGAITPSDTVKLNRRARSVYVGTGGSVSILALDGTSATFANVPSGTVLPVWTDRVNSTGTTASDLVALY